MSDKIVHWEELESSVYSLLKASGIEVHKDIQMGSQQVDILATKRDLGITKRIAIECKAYEEPLTKNEVANIFVKYISLYEERLIDEILIVTLSDITATAKQMVNAKRNLYHLTLDDLLSSVMDFSVYVNNLINGFLNDDVSHYYIPMRANRIGKQAQYFDLFDYVQNWIDMRNPRPIALLSSYGMGKTTFARHLAYKLAHSWIECQTRRLPILIDLGRISDEQSLEGMLGKILTSETIVRGYSIDLLMELNRLGRLVIILDSFDEMKHGITWTAFLRNFEEIKRLLTGDSRIIVCGRPSIFLSESEHREVLDDEHQVGQQWIRQTTFEGFEEISLMPLQDQEIKEFLGKYIGFLHSSKGGGQRKSARALKHMQEEGSTHLFDLARRPVQLKMLATVLPEWEHPLERLSLTVLYSEFIDIIIKRECKKAAREAISVQQRRRFAQKLAWYMWAEKHTHFVRMDEIPQDIFESVRVRSNLPERALRREFVVACAIDVKPPDLMFFPHRSIQEFLIAEHVSELMQETEISIPELLRHLNQEVSDFLAGIIGEESLLKWATTALQSFRGKLPNVIDQLLKPVWGGIAGMVKPGVTSPWPGLYAIRMGSDSNSLFEVGSEAYIHYGAHQLLLNCFPSKAYSDMMEEMYKEMHPNDYWRYYMPSSESFVPRLKDILKMEAFRREDSHALRTLANLLTSIAIYTKSNIVQLGGLRGPLYNYYAGTSSLEDTTLPQYCFGSSTAMAEDRIKELQKILSYLRGVSRRYE